MSPIARGSSLDSSPDHQDVPDMKGENNNQEDSARLRHAGW